MAITNVGVIGCGLMGSGIVQVAAQAGFQVLFVEANDELVRRALARLGETLEGLVVKGKLDAKTKDATLARIAGFGGPHNTATATGAGARGCSSSSRAALQSRASSRTVCA